MIAVRGKPGDAPTSDEELRKLDELHGPAGWETPIGAMLGALLIRSSNHPKINSDRRIGADLALKAPNESGE